MVRSEQQSQLSAMVAPIFPVEYLSYAKPTLTVILLAVFWGCPSSTGEEGVCVTRAITSPWLSSITAPANQLGGWFWSKTSATQVRVSSRTGAGIYRRTSRPSTGMKSGIRSRGLRA
jgi:hypothetical protein